MERLTLDDTIKALRCVASQDTGGGCYADHENFIHMDDEYKRIVCGTGKDLRDPISDKEAVGCPYYQDTYECCFEDGGLYWLKDVAELLEELKSYKDLEEQGLLVRLPCKVGDDLYCIVNGEVKKLKVHSFGVPDFEITDIEFKYVDGFKIVRFVGEVGKTVFLTREEAEKMLKEMKKNG